MSQEVCYRLFFLSGSAWMDLLSYWEHKEKWGIATIMYPILWLILDASSHDTPGKIFGLKNIPKVIIAQRWEWYGVHYPFRSSDSHATWSHSCSSTTPCWTNHHVEVHVSGQTHTGHWLMFLGESCVFCPRTVNWQQKNLSLRDRSRRSRDIPAACAEKRWPSSCFFFFSYPEPWAQSMIPLI